jgi:hypothetical protein
VNNVLVNYVNYVNRVGDFFTFFFNSHAKIHANLFKRLKTQTILFNTPRYMLLVINYFMRLC